ncbi:MAG: SIS domain-containing protein [FCB group bacterium]|nr:SIS domain-containing protein [FCB group bacterium]
MKKEKKIAYLKKVAGEAARLRKTVMEQTARNLLDISAVISGVLGSGGKILIAGNGGSAADASHFAGEMVVRLSAQKNRQSLPTIALTTDAAVITACGNDYGFEHIFARQVEGLGNKGDMLFVISTSGNSLNLIKAVQIAHEKGLLTVGLLGNEGGKLGKMIERKIVIPHSSTQRIQEEHIFIIHLLVELVESDLF